MLFVSHLNQCGLIHIMANMIPFYFAGNFSVSLCAGDLESKQMSSTHLHEFFLFHCFSPKLVNFHVSRTSKQNNLKSITHILIFFKHWKNGQNLRNRAVLGNLFRESSSSNKGLTQQRSALASTPKSELSRLHFLPSQLPC